MGKRLPVSKHNKMTTLEMPHNTPYKKIFVHNSFYKFMSRRMARGTLPQWCFVSMGQNTILIPLCLLLSPPSLQ